jgi:hypothetical protein
MSDINRRTFLTGISAAAGLTIVPRRVLGGQGFVAPSDMIRLARWRTATSPTGTRWRRGLARVSLEPCAKSTTRAIGPSGPRPSRHTTRLE